MWRVWTGSIWLRIGTGDGSGVSRNFVRVGGGVGVQQIQLRTERTGMWGR